VVLAWVLLFTIPTIVTVLAGRRYRGPADPGKLNDTQVSQGFAGGIFASLSGALIVTVLGTGTIALMLNAAWLRNLFDHGQHLNAIVMYSHELDASNNAEAYLVMCLLFPIIGVFMSAVGTAGVRGSASATGQGGPPRGGGPGRPGPAAGPPSGGREVEAGSGGQKLAANPFPDPGRDENESPADLVGAAGGPMTRTG